MPIEGFDHSPHVYNSIESGTGSVILKIYSINALDPSETVIVFVFNYLSQFVNLKGVV